ncbi:MAG: response regulator transcription factor [Planctomycetota bacterium]|nr:response regulator transcription factor [Planctomycetota bacterium]MEC8895674.1 response regulator transcription factor [Planctomycetota bacterium]MEE3297416.1 response regulator transcription factor [Planctomycetota bacterium]
MAARNKNSNKKKARVLIVEDDSSLLFGLKKNLQFEGYEVLTASDGEAGLGLAVDERPDLIILDVMLPRMNGFEVCEVLRSNKVETPVIFLTAKALESDKVTGLTLGGDDYMTKPFSVAELLARIQTVLRRVNASEGEKLTIGPLELDLSGRSVLLEGKEVNLTTKEFELLCFMARNIGKVLPRERILQEVWGYNYYGTARTIDNFINRLRQKIEENPLEPRFLLTVRGVGYKFRPPQA